MSKKFSFIFVLLAIISENSKSAFRPIFVSIYVKCSNENAQNKACNVISAKAEIQFLKLIFLDSRLRGNDNC